jgi:hypothetical protein
VARVLTVTNDLEKLRLGGAQARSRHSEAAESREGIALSHRFTRIVHHDAGKVSKRQQTQRRRARKRTSFVIAGYDG